MARKTIFAALGVAALVTASVALAHPPHGRHGGGPLHGLVRSLEDVELTDAQETQLEQLVAAIPSRERGRRGGSPEGRHGERRHGDACHGDARHGDARHGDARHGDARRGGAPSDEARAQHRSAREAHRTLILDELRSDAMDAAALHAMVDGGPRGEAPAEIHTVIDELVAFHATLTPDQRTQWVAAIETRMAERAERHRLRREEMGADDAVE